MHSQTLRMPLTDLRTSYHDAISINIETLIDLHSVDPLIMDHLDLYGVI